MEEICAGRGKSGNPLVSPQQFSVWRRCKKKGAHEGTKAQRAGGIMIWQSLILTSIECKEEAK